MSRFRSYSIGDLYKSSKPGAPVLDVSKWASEVLDEQPFYERDELTGAWTVRENRLVYDSPVSDARFVWKGDFDVSGDRLMGGTVTNFKSLNSPASRQMNMPQGSYDDFPELLNLHPMHVLELKRLDRLERLERSRRGWNDLVESVGYYGKNTFLSNASDNLAFESAAAFITLVPMRSPLQPVLLF